jgi:hypothetical protein
MSLYALLGDDNEGRTKKSLPCWIWELVDEYGPLPLLPVNMARLICVRSSKNPTLFEFSASIGGHAFGKPSPRNLPFPSDRIRGKTWALQVHFVHPRIAISKKRSKDVAHSSAIKSAKVDDVKVDENHKATLAANDTAIDANDKASNTAESQIKQLCLIRLKSAGSSTSAGQVAKPTHIDQPKLHQTTRAEFGGTLTYPRVQVWFDTPLVMHTMTICFHLDGNFEVPHAKW